MKAKKKKKKTKKQQKKDKLLCTNYSATMMWKWPS